ncbi:uncharacterized protein BDZ99DRAFT_519778 [Mytilinidion resinicola]|uniref:Uncharacterized protein n=1 Tax=Mytilinidion resinicola TaxID=574789 RepID=A0A6A6YSU6_9PEZI|nr:uncharacterized protein BDZ99DRAFT_519778 [Mytilinidion resinicola]KAF2811114.1 hypothetical protein BDZ99DRAFT_519778 [Mytilinidion resinicola]
MSDINSETGTYRSNIDDGERTILGANADCRTESVATDAPRTITSGKASDTPTMTAVSDPTKDAHFIWFTTKEILSNAYFCLPMGKFVVGIGCDRNPNCDPAQKWVACLREMETGKLVSKEHGRHKREALMELLTQVRGSVLTAAGKLKEGSL